MTKISDTESNASPTPPTRLTGSEILWATLVGEGVDTVFGYPGGAILPAYDALRKFPIRHVLVRHEQGAAHMADGYARASGKVGVAIATSGPGATNLVTGIATAMLDSIPIVCITGNVSSKVLGTDAFQEVDITGITLPVTKHNFLVNKAEDLAHALRLAFQIARSGRPGPVLVDITKDAQQATAEFDFEAAKPRPYRPHPDAARRRFRIGASRGVDSQLQAAGDSGWSRRDGVGRDGAGAHAGRARRDSRGLDAAGAGRISRVAPAEHGHDGYARRGVGESRHPGS
jgi:glyoxylate carboligase